MSARRILGISRREEGAGAPGEVAFAFGAPRESWGLALPESVLGRECFSPTLRSLRTRSGFLTACRLMVSRSVLVLNSETNRESLGASLSRDGGTNTCFFSFQRVSYFFSLGFFLGALACFFGALVAVLRLVAAVMARAVLRLSTRTRLRGAGGSPEPGSKGPIKGRPAACRTKANARKRPKFRLLRPSCIIVPLNTR